jgi:hypothetical protein
MKRVVVATLAKADEIIDALAYRPAVVKAFTWLPRWWNCDLARMSIALDHRWGLGWWDEYGPEGVCEACGRRAAWIVVGGWDEDLLGPRTADDDAFVDDRQVSLCGWCKFPQGPFPQTEGQLQEELRRARQDSIAWRWGA